MTPWAILFLFPAIRQPPQLGHEMGLVAVRTNSVAELGFRVAGNVGVNLFPVVPVVANLLAVGADGEKPLKLLHAPHSIFKLLKAFQEGFL